MTAIKDLTVEDVRIVNYVLTTVAVLVTCLRLGDRMRTAQLWWDDAWAAFTMVLLVIFMAAVEVHLQDPLTWSARMSILLTVIRISLGTMRKLLVWIGVLFGITWAILFSQIWWVCEGHPKWKTSPAPQCPLGLDVAIAQVITDVISDAILILAPIRLVWRTKLTPHQKIRVITIFSTTLITTAISLNHAYFVLKWGGLQEALAAVMQCCVSLIVANLSVIIALLCRISTEEAGEVTVSTFSLVPLQEMGATTLAYLSWQKRGPALPVTSTFLTTGGVVRTRGRLRRGYHTSFDGTTTHSRGADTEREIGGKVNEYEDGSVTVEEKV